ncbi:hypothetical protein B8V81_0412 [Paenibacillus pasadenensis]|uniref:Uncharacterized protein n=1 Tax=Paenibacillus pasadenensis TaxID=217090 RepID=A0A2N5NDD5_9BACL|nr:hypothetical protein B8V81_0412 [Paenibacillus pasadenensis]
MSEAAHGGPAASVENICSYSSRSGCDWQDWVSDPAPLSASR